MENPSDVPDEAVLNFIALLTPEEVKVQRARAAAAKMEFADFVRVLIFTCISLPKMVEAARNREEVDAAYLEILRSRTNRTVQEEADFLTLQNRAAERAAECAAYEKWMEQRHAEIQELYKKLREQ